MAERFAAARTLAVVGAGPKGIAIAAKARALAPGAGSGRGGVVGPRVEPARGRGGQRGGERPEAGGVVFPGGAPPIPVAGQPRQHPRVLDGRNYWLAEPAFGKQVAQSVCVIGS